MNEARLFYTDEAQELGVPEAVFINYLRLFIRGNKQKGQNIDEDGRTWTYARYEDIAEEHPFWTVPQVGRLVRKLREAGIIYAEKRGYAPETWFAFVDENRLRNRSDVATKSSRHGNESVESTIYTEEKLKNTKEGGTKRERFSAPTYDEVVSFAKEKNLADYSEQFVDYYTAAGWMMGKRQMKDWRAAYRNWCRNERKFDRGRGVAPVGALMTYQEMLSHAQKNGFAAGSNKHYEAVSQGENKKPLWRVK